MNNNSPGMKLWMGLLTLMLLTYFGIQAVSFFMDPFSSTLVYTYQVEEEIDLSGYVVRQERVLPDENADLLQINRAEGERVSAGGTVARVYADHASVTRQAEIETLNARIDQLQYAQEAALSVEAAVKMDEQILQSLLDYRGALAADKLYDAQEEGVQLRSLVMKRDFTYTENTDFSARLEELRAELKALRTQAAGSVRRVTAPETGLYSAVVDGFESVLYPDMLRDLTPTAFSALRADGSLVSSVGKLVLGDDWYYIAVMKTETAKKLQGQDLTLRFSKNVERDLQVTVEFVGAEENGRSVVVLRGDTYLSQLTLLRKQSARLITNTVEGIRVPKDALRVQTRTLEQDGATEETKTTGVYCVVGMEARFKPVEVLHSGDGFVLVRSAAPEGSEVLRLRPGDEVIISAKDLYDGKVVSSANKT